MSSSRLMMPLIRAHFDADHATFVRLSKEVARDFESAGKRMMSQDIIELLARDAGGVMPAVNVELPEDLKNLVEGCQPTITLDDIVLHPEIASTFDRIVKEQKNAAVLRAHGVLPRRKMLLSGPPGTGKTMSASALAGSLGIPLYVIRIDGLFRSYLGETGQNLRRIFEAMAKHHGVWLFDEIDALAADRSRSNDAGEARRVLNSLLQLIEKDNSGCLVAGATNLLPLLDEAIIRRFHVGIVYTNPDDTGIRALVERKLHRFDLTGLDWTRTLSAAGGMSPSDIVEAAENAARVAILDRDCRLEEDDLVAAFESRRMLHRDKSTPR